MNKERSDLVDGRDAPLTGAVPPERVRGAPTRPPPSLMERLGRVPDVVATIADVLDALGLNGATGATTLRPTVPGASIIGPAVTVRKVPAHRQPTVDAAASRSDVGEIEGVNQSRPGDVLVIEGQPDVSAMGGLVADMCVRQGVIGSVVAGGVRDVAHARHIGFPAWTTHVTPLTGKWRSEVVEINGRVTVAGLIVEPGDVVVADDTGVAIVPLGQSESIVAAVERIAERETRLRDALRGDGPLHMILGAAR